jgi:multisite-specific tRNA:(cytosine-C5)-methyltransferase
MEVVSSLTVGGVIANELDENRARMLTHRLKALTSANILVVNQDACRFPRLKVGFTPETYHGGHVVAFDRIICDVPCSGDGTLRKVISASPPTECGFPSLTQL